MRRAPVIHTPAEGTRSACERQSIRRVVAGATSGPPTGARSGTPVTGRHTTCNDRRTTAARSAHETPYQARTPDNTDYLGKRSMID
jgi:hypothetical protein